VASQPQLTDSLQVTETLRISLPAVLISGKDKEESLIRNCLFHKAAF